MRGCGRREKSKEGGERVWKEGEGESVEGGRGERRDEDVRGGRGERRGR